MDLAFLLEAFWIALTGVPLALLVTVVTLMIAVPIGFILAVFRVNNIPVIKQLSIVYLSFVRGTPLIVQIFLIYSTIPLILNMTFQKYQIDYDIFAIHPVWYAFIIFSFHMIAILMEVFRGGLSTIDQGQREAALAAGLSPVQTYIRILIPQVFANALPNLSTATIHLIKATSLGYAISLQEITLRTKVAANVGYNYLEAYIDIFIVYIILCSIVEFAFKRMEERLKKYQGLSE
ncbi:MAG TPA: amino acid ABC transporter permease [Pseudogracilibacillus sp.]|nr:amino acid ABC transporter permease [Pseudogracilibacillus sp.]